MSEDYAAIAQAASEQAKKEMAEAEDIGPERKMLRKMWQVPAMRQLLTTFRQQLGIPSFSSEEFETSLVGPTEFTNVLLHELHVKLLRGILTDVPRDMIAAFSWEQVLKNLLKEHNVPLCEDDPSVTEYKLVTLSDRVRLLMWLCEQRVDEEDLRAKMRSDEAVSVKLKELPVGFDAHGNSYWNFDNDTRLFKQCKGVHPGQGQKKGNAASTAGAGAESKSADGEASSSSSASTSVPIPDTQTAEDGPSFSVVAITLEEWKKFAGSMKRSKNRHERAMYGVLTTELIPRIEADVETVKRAKERHIMWDLMPRRRSDRVATKVVEDERAAAEAQLMRQQQAIERELLRKAKEKTLREERAAERSMKLYREIYGVELQVKDGTAIEVEGKAGGGGGGASGDGQGGGSGSLSSTSAMLNSAFAAAEEAERQRRQELRNQRAQEEKEVEVERVRLQAERKFHQRQARALRFEQRAQGISLARKTREMEAEIRAKKARARAEKAAKVRARALAGAGGSGKRKQKARDSDVSEEDEYDVVEVAMAVTAGAGAGVGSESGKKSGGKRKAMNKPKDRGKSKDRGKGKDRGKDKGKHSDGNKRRRKDEKPVQKHGNVKGREVIFVDGRSESSGTGSGSASASASASGSRPVVPFRPPSVPIQDLAGVRIVRMSPFDRPAGLPVKSRMLPGMEWVHSHLPGMPDPAVSADEWKELVLGRKARLKAALKAKAEAQAEAGAGAGDSRSLSPVYVRIPTLDDAKRLTVWPPVDGQTYDELVENIVAEFSGRMAAAEHKQKAVAKRSQEAKQAEAEGAQKRAAEHAHAQQRHQIQSDTAASRLRAVMEQDRLVSAQGQAQTQAQAEASAQTLMYDMQQLPQPFLLATASGQHQYPMYVPQAGGEMQARGQGALMQYDLNVVQQMRQMQAQAQAQFDYERAARAHAHARAQAQSQAQGQPATYAYGQPLPRGMFALSALAQPHPQPQFQFQPRDNGEAPM